MKLVTTARFAGLGITIGAAIAICGSATAGSFVVAPVRVDLSSVKRSAELAVSNDDDAPLTLQLRVMAWNQLDEQDVLSNTTNLLATPTVFELTPHESRKIRVALRQAPVRSVEVAYRLFIEVVPQGALSRPGIQVALRMSVPVFAAPEVAVKKPLVWHAVQHAGVVSLSVFNASNGSSRLVNLRATPVSGDALPIAYVLAGQRRTWVLPFNAERGEPKLLHITGLTEDGSLSADVPVELQ